MSDKIKFVQELQLAYPQNIYEQDHAKHFRNTLEAGENEAQSFLADAGIVSFAAGVSSVYRQDVLNSVLIAQMAANGAFPDKKDLMKWFNEYMRVLTGLGWVIQQKTFKDDFANHGLIEIENVIIDIISTAISGSIVPIIKSALAAFRKLSESSNNKIIAFEKNSHTISEGTFQIGVASESGKPEDKEKAISMKMGAFLLSASEEIRQILFFKSKREDTKLKVATFEVTLNLDSYGGIRDVVKQKLGVKALDFITELKA